MEKTKEPIVELQSMNIENSVLGASGAAIFALLYKIWRVMKRDTQQDNLGNAERSLRDELREEIKGLKKEKQDLFDKIISLTQEVTRLQVEVEHYKNICLSCKYHDKLDQSQQAGQ